MKFRVSPFVWSRERLQLRGNARRSSGRAPAHAYVATGARIKNKNAAGGAFQAPLPQFFSSVKPSQCEPSQKGLRFDLPQRHRA